ncbi:MAG: hypothetical protein ACI8SJ_000907 [Shewanella sp.]|jgi:hypothetical protein
MDAALTKIAAIHQQHALKCYLATESLKARFNWSMNDWSKVEKLIELEEPSVNLAILQSDLMPFEPIRKRRHWILSHAIYPYAYFTMQDWFQESTAEDIFNHYFQQCTESNEYLSHNISILISFKLAWPKIVSENQKLRFIERFCEFVTATFYGNNHQSYPLHQDYVANTHVDMHLVLKSAIKQPGFWGHHLIALASIVRVKSEIPGSMFNKLLSNLFEQCHWDYEDDTDKPKIAFNSDKEVSNQTLESACFALLTHSQNNLHQITLADSISYIFEQNWVSPIQKSKLINIVNYFSKDSAFP